MFKIHELTLLSTKNESFIYKLEEGINFYKGRNSTGKTEFYNFIDYMFGSSNDLRELYWFNDSLSYAILKFQKDSITYELKRSIDPEECYFKYDYEDWGTFISLEEYKERLNVIFTPNEMYLKELRDFAQEEMTYRTFTLFNFYSEKSSGRLNNFFHKGQEVKYFVKLAAILNFIFNRNLLEISKLKKELDELQLEVDELERLRNRFEYTKNNVNLNLKKLKLDILYTGMNKEEVVNELLNMKNMNKKNEKPKKHRTISELQSIYFNLDEQIKIYENRVNDSKRIGDENNNREKLIKTFHSLIKNKPEFNYLIEPISNMLNELDKSIAFSTYVTKNNTMSKLKEQLDDVKKEIEENKLKYTIFSLEDKIKSMALVEEYLNDNIEFDLNELERKLTRIKTLKKEIKRLQNEDDESKIEKVSKFITNLYKSAGSVSEFVSTDINKEGFCIKYIKRGNTLQPQIIDTDKDNEYEEEKKLVNYSVGSMARQTLIQLCGYLAFLKLLIEEDKYPVIPLLVIDHVSKPFDEDNRKAIGEVLKTFYNSVGKDKIQMIVMDDKNNEDLNILVNHSEELQNIDITKTGFNPFFVEKNYNSK